MALHVQQTPFGVIERDADFKVSKWNPSAERIFGYRREEAIGRHHTFRQFVASTEERRGVGGGTHGNRAQKAESHGIPEHGREVLTH